MQIVFISVYFVVFESVAKVTYNKLLPDLACSSHTKEYWSSVVLYGPRCARYVLPRPRAKIPLHGPRAWLVRV